ncbi:hypothetical protein A9Q99_24490 [Gammaproteobacteria bacterium 45_16_T64]|nr:hypothetical protein A9Q99_24490 [Gammaproteobacteria bacterium 45_16_T64]
MTNNLFTQITGATGSPRANTFKALSFAGVMFAGLLTLPTLSHAAPSLTSYDKQISQLTNSLGADDNQIKVIERTLWALDTKILSHRKQLRQERSSNRTASHEAKREVKRQSFEKKRIETAIRLLDKDIQLLQRDTQRSTDYYQSLNPFKRQLEAENHKKKIDSNQQRSNQLHADKLTLEAELKAVLAVVSSAEQQLLALGNSQNSASFEMDPKLQSILAQRETQASLIISLRKQVKRNKGLLSKTRSNRLELAEHIKFANSAPAPAAITPKNIQKRIQQRASKPEFASYVFAISGEYEPNIEDTLQLKDWVESYEAKYIQANWNGFEGNSGSESTALFKSEFEAKLKAIHKDANIILIGHGRGGGAAIEAATEVASTLGRGIEFLAVIDPIGSDNLRANIVYNDSNMHCTVPTVNDRIINTEYSNCIKDAQRREITSNIKHFYNRWQKDNKGPLDYQRRIAIVANDGTNIDVPTATGRFDTSATIESDQKRVFIGAGKNAHRALLAQASKTLPKLLVKHLR